MPRRVVINPKTPKINACPPPGQARLSSIQFGDTMVPNIEEDSVLLLGYSILYKAYNLTGFNHQKNTTHLSLAAGFLSPSYPGPAAHAVGRLVQRLPGSLTGKVSPN